MTFSWLLRSSGDINMASGGDRTEPGLNEESQASREKRGRSESGEPAAPARKKLQVAMQSELSSMLEVALERTEAKMRALLSEELHEVKVIFESQIARMEERIKELEKHVEMRDEEMEATKEELKEAKQQINELNLRAEKAELNSRIPCLVFSGRAMAPRRAVLAPPVAGESAPPGAMADPDPVTGDRARTGTRAPDGALPDTAGTTSVTSASTSPASSAREGSAPGGGATTVPSTSGEGARLSTGTRGRAHGDTAQRGEQEDVAGLIIETLQRRFPDLAIARDDIDRAHRLPGVNNRVIVRFVRSGRGSVRDQLMWRRRELRSEHELFINESLTQLRSKIQKSLLAAKKDRKIYTVYTRWGQVYFKWQQYGAGQRVETMQKLEELGFREYL